MDPSFRALHTISSALWPYPYPCCCLCFKSIPVISLYASDNALTTHWDNGPELHSIHQRMLSMLLQNVVHGPISCGLPLCQPKSAVILACYALINSLLDFDGVHCSLWLLIAALDVHYTQHRFNYLFQYCRVPGRSAVCWKTLPVTVSSQARDQTRIVAEGTAMQMITSTVSIRCLTDGRHSDACWDGGHALASTSVTARFVNLSHCNDHLWCSPFCFATPFSQTRLHSFLPFLCLHFFHSSFFPLPLLLHLYRSHSDDSSLPSAIGHKCCTGPIAGHPPINSFLQASIPNLVRRRFCWFMKRLMPHASALDYHSLRECAYFNNGRLQMGPQAPFTAGSRNDMCQV